MEGMDCIQFNNVFVLVCVTLKKFSQINTIIIYIIIIIKTLIFHYAMTLFWLTISYSGHMVAWLSQKVVGLIPRPIGGRAECEWLFVFLCDKLASVPGLNLIRQS